MASSNTGVTRIIKAARYSCQGLNSAFRLEAAFRQELLLFAIFCPLGLYLGKDGIEQVLLIGPLFLILIIELLNSAIEAVVDRFGGELHELSGRAKDIGSAAVLLSLLLAVLSWLLILGSRL